MRWLGIDKGLSWNVIYRDREVYDLRWIWKLTFTSETIPHKSKPWVTFTSIAPYSVDACVFTASIIVSTLINLCVCGERNHKQKRYKIIRLSKSISSPTPSDILFPSPLPPPTHHHTLPLSHLHKTLPFGFVSYSFYRCIENQMRNTV